MTDTQFRPAHAAGTVGLGARRVHRLGYGAMRLTGERTFGPPPDRAAALAVLRRAVELGVDFLDTADVYGPWISEELIREALHPFGHVLVATKGGMVRFGTQPGQWRPCGRPDFLRQQVEGSLSRLGVERIELYQLHRIDPTVPITESVGALADLAVEGKIGAIGLSEVGIGELEVARTVTDIASVQNRYSVADRTWDPLLEHCTAHGIAFIPWYPFATGALAGPDSALSQMARNFGATPAQLALAWLLHRSPVLLPIPGTRSLAHLEENVAAAHLVLTEAQHAALTAAA